MFRLFGVLILATGVASGASTGDLFPTDIIRLRNAAETITKAVTLEQVKAYVTNDLSSSSSGSGTTYAFSDQFTVGSSTNVSLASGLSVTNLTVPALASKLLGTDGSGIVSGTFASSVVSGSVSDETGSGVLVFATSPTLVTPVLGVAAATSINKVALTAPASSATLTISDGKTLASTASLTLSGTDATVMTFPSTSATIARTDAANTFTGHQTIEGVTSTGATGTGKMVFDTSPIVQTKLTLTGATETASNPVLDITQTWNNSGVTFVGAQMVFTDTASGSSSPIRWLPLGPQLPLEPAWTSRTPQFLR